MPPRDTSDDTSERRLRSMALAIAPADIAFFKAVIESYDNLATLRTEDPEQHHLRLWFAAESEQDINELISSLSSKLSLRILKVE
jgi:hypothetical protein